MNVAVFTAAIGSQTDQIKPPTVIADGVTYYAMVTGGQDPPTPWQEIRIGEPRMGNVPSDWFVRQARLCKMRPDVWLPGVDYSLWIDAAYRLDVSPLDIIGEMPADADICVLEHPDRQNIRQEGAELVRLGLASQDDIDNQLEDLREFADRQTRLSSTGLLLRRHSASVTAFNQVWDNQFMQGGHTRDQMTFDAVADAGGVRVHFLRGHYRDNPYAKWFPNRRRRG